MLEVKPTGDSQLESVLPLIERVHPTRPPYIPMEKKVVRTLLYGYSEKDVDPYEGFVVPEDLRPAAKGGLLRDTMYPSSGKTCHREFATVVKQVLGHAPRAIAEVGVFVGTSSVWNWGPQAREGGGVVISVDTWQGDINMKIMPGFGTQYMRSRHGMPRLYETFVTNVVQSNLTDVIFPLPMPSILAARLLPLTAGYLMSPTSTARTKKGRRTSSSPSIGSSFGLGGFSWEMTSTSFRRSGRTPANLPRTWQWTSMRVSRSFPKLSARPCRGRTSGTL